MRSYASALKAFIAWNIGKGYLDTDPLRRLSLSKYSAAPKAGSERRRITQKELSALLEAAPEHRRLMYEVAVRTGLRAREIRMLRVSDLNVAKSVLMLRPETTKSRKPCVHPIPRDLAERLAAYAETGEALKIYKRFGSRKDRKRRDVPSDPLLYVSSHTGRDINVDIEAAKIPKFKPGEGKLDYHALRVTFISQVCENPNVTIKEAMTLARHSDPRLTLQTYARTSHARLSEIVGQSSQDFLTRGQEEDNSETEEVEIPLASRGLNGGGNASGIQPTEEIAFILPG